MRQRLAVYAGLFLYIVVGIEKFQKQIQMTRLSEGAFVNVII